MEIIPLCCNASVKEGEHFINNKIFSYSMDETWENVLKDLLEDFIFILTSSLHGITGACVESKICSLCRRLCRVKNMLAMYLNN